MAGHQQADWINSSKSWRSVHKAAMARQHLPSFQFLCHWSHPPCRSAGIFSPTYDAIFQSAHSVQRAAWVTVSWIHCSSLAFGDLDQDVRPSTMSLEFKVLKFINLRPPTHIAHENEQLDLEQRRTEKLSNVGTETYIVNDGSLRRADFYARARNRAPARCSSSVGL